MPDAAADSLDIIPPSKNRRRSELFELMELAASLGWIIRGLKYDIKNDSVSYAYFGPDDAYSIKLMRAIAPSFFTAMVSIALGRFGKDIPAPEFIKNAKDMLQHALGGSSPVGASNK